MQHLLTAAAVSLFVILSALAAANDEGPNERITIEAPTNVAVGPS